MKVTTRVMMAAMLAVSVQAIAARKGSSRVTMDNGKAPDTVVVYRTDTVYINNNVSEDGEVNEVAQIVNQYQLEAYKAKLENEKLEQIRQDETNSRRRRIEDDQYENKAYFRLVSSYLSAFMLGLVLPCLVVFLYLHYSKNRQRRYEMLVDLMRSGVEVKPEMIDALSLNRIKMNWRLSIPKTGKAVAAQHYIYCLKRVAWALACLFISFAFATMVNSGMFFGFGVIVAVVLFVQAAVRYFSLLYLSKNVDATVTGNGLAGDTQANITGNTENINHTPTSENNAQQP